MKQLNVKIPDELYKSLKTEAIKKDIKLKELIVIKLGGVKDE